MIKEKVSISVIVLVLLTLTIIGCNRSNYVYLNIDKISKVNRSIELSDYQEDQILSLDAKEGSGLAQLDNIDFEEGTIELDIKGENTPGRSFVGIAFNIQNDTTYEAIYFRPFNFQSPEKIRREHSIQYVSHPENGWRKLRSERPGEFEAEYDSPPDPNDWFRVRVSISEGKVEVEDYISGKVLFKSIRLTDTESNKIGFWTGFNSRGSFRKLRIIKI